VTNFVQVFHQALDQLEAEAREVDLTLTSICRETGVSRATPDRWRKKIPTTIQLLSDMQQVVTDRKAKLAEDKKNALHHD
jgi:hypothetical protein